MAESDILSPDKTEVMFMIFFGIKYCLSDISGYFRANSDINLHFLRYAMHIQWFLSIKCHKNELPFWATLKLN